MVAFSAGREVKRSVKTATAPRPFRMPLRFVLWQEDGRWWAQCLEINALGDGRDMKEALGQLASAIGCTVDFCIRHHAEDSIIQPADPDAWNMFLRGETVTREALLEIDIKRLDPNPIEIRRALSAPVHA